MVLHVFLLWQWTEHGKITAHITEKTCIFGKNEGKVKIKKQIPKRKVYLELLHQRLGHRSTRSTMSGDTANVWKDINIRVYPDLLWKSCQISTINKNHRSKTPLKTKTPFKWVFMDIIPAISSKSLTKDTSFDNYPSIVDDYSNILKLYGM